jgi:hypothetical protein
MTEVPTIEKPKKVSNFKTKYYSRPEYREKHLQYVKQRITCKICGGAVQRSNMSKHNVTELHKRMLARKIEEEKELKATNTEKLINELSKKLDELKTNLKVIKGI